MAVARGIYAVCEEREAPPTPSDDELRAQHALVVRLASRTDAMLPVRFGTLVSAAQLRRVVHEHASEIRTALDDVRGKVQMTVRVVARPPERTVPNRAVPWPSGLSGRDYLERKRQAAALPAAAQKVVEAVAPFVVKEERGTAAGQLLATVYHLVWREHVNDYRRAAKRVRSGALVTGPWPPFAFTPRWP